jgi:long-subunit fatty acid transport protein
MKRLLILVALGVTAYKLTRRQPVQTPPSAPKKASRGRRLALATLACVLVSAAAYGAYITLIDGSGTATAPLGADATTNTITLHFTIPAGLTPGQSAPFTGPGPNGGVTADVQGGGSALIQGIKLGSITTSDPTHCLPAWFSIEEYGPILYPL